MKRRRWINSGIFIILLAIVVVSCISLAEEAIIDEGESQVVEELSRLSTNELEKRLDEVEREIDELEIKEDYLKSEEPVYFDYSPSAAERTGFISREEAGSKLLNPKASEDIKLRLNRLHRLKEAIENELDERGE